MTPENKKELIKKVTAVIILGLLFFFVRMLYLKENKTSPVKTVKTVKTVAVKTPLAAPNEKKFQKLFSPSYIRSSDKNELIKLASQNVGKKDPFMNNSSKQPASSISGNTLPNTSLALGQSTTNVLPPPPGVLSDFPPFQTIIPDNEPVLKGFIGNKAIINYKGTNKAVSKNQTCEDIKITSIMANNLSIEYMQKGKKHFKQLKPINNDTINIIK
ncbi:MAG: hypothetical protein WC197_05100 [Candidatus Gastranaerophilaceae bacterium]|jgi:hypothetical protein